MGLTFLADGGLGGLSAGDFWDFLSSVFAKELFDVFFFEALNLFVKREKKKIKKPLTTHVRYFTELAVHVSWRCVILLVSCVFFFSSKFY